MQSAFNPAPAAPPIEAAATPKKTDAVPNEPILTSPPWTSSLPPAMV